MVRVVISLTTLPSRYDLLLTTLKSLRNQRRLPDAIYLGIPVKSSRLDLGYPDLSEDITKLCTVISLKIDYGPICKILGGVLRESDPDTLIISVDDDMIYGPEFIEDMVSKASKYPNSAIGYTGMLIGKSVLNYSSVSALTPSWNRVTGFPVPPEGRPVDILCGVSGVAYRRRFLDNMAKILNLTTIEDLFYNDDVLISAHLSSNRIERRLFIDGPKITEQKSNKTGDEISFSRVKFLARLHRAINECRAQKLFTTQESCVNDSAVAWGIAILILIFIILLVVWLIYNL